MNAAGRALRWLAVHTTVAAVLALVGLTWWAADRDRWPLLAGATGLLAVALGGAAELRPSTTVHKPVDGDWLGEEYGTHPATRLRDGAGINPGMPSDLQP